MVRLKEGMHEPLYCIELNFNSTMVRLKEYIKNHMTLQFYRFQFHYGTIKGSYRFLPSKHIKIFQFHSGTIKGSFVFKLPYSISHFNSTLVRLKDCYFLAIELY